jgi:Protein of unknown function, DUF488
VAGRSVTATGAGRGLVEESSTEGRVALPPPRRSRAGWDEFKAAHYAELEEAAAQTAVHSLLDRLTRQPVTLLFAARGRDSQQCGVEGVARLPVRLSQPRHKVRNLVQAQMQSRAY